MNLFSKVDHVSAKTFRRFIRWVPFFPAYRNTGGRIKHISDDWRTWEVELPMEGRTRNYVGTHYGGTMYSAADPLYMFAFLHILGDAHIVWDKAATIRFRKPGKGTLHGSFTIAKAEIAEVKRRCRKQPKVDRTYTFLWKDAEGDVVAEIEKVLHFRLKKSKGSKNGA